MGVFKSKKEYEAFFEDLLLKQFAKKYDKMWKDFVKDKWTEYEKPAIFKQ